MSVVYVNSLNDVPSFLSDSCIVFGVFDGIHEGHLFEINQCINESKEKNKNSVILTFDIDPDELFVDDFVKLLNNSDRISNLDKLGADYVCVLDFLAFKNYSGIDFLNLFFGGCTPYSIHIGEGFLFGFNHSGDISLLKKWSRDNGMIVHVHELLKKDGKIISSTRLRKQLR